MLYKVVLTFESVNEILKCDHSKESYWAVLSCGTVYYAVQGVTIQMKATEQYFPVVLFIILYNVVLNLSLRMKSFGMTIQMKATDHYIPMVLSELGAF